MRRVRVLTMGGGLFGLILITAALLLAPASHPAQVQADQTSDATLLELAQRYIQGISSGQVELLPAALPGDLPITVPLPDGNRLIGSVTRRSATRTVSWEILFDTASNPTDVTAFYERALQPTGWKTPTPFDYSSYYVPTGFQDQRIYTAPTRTPIPRTPTPTTSASLRLCPASGDTGIVVSARAMPSGVTGVTVRIDNASACNYDALRSSPTASLPPPAIPSLHAPANVAVSSISYDDEPDTVSEATAETDMSPAELEAFYAKQLIAAGWTRISGDARGPLAWSLWSTPKGKQGYLSVLEIAGARTRDLHLQIASIGDDDDDNERTLPASNRGG